MGAMSNANNVETPEDDWEQEDMHLDPSNYRKSTDQEDKELDDALGLQMISIRLQKDLLDQLKLIAKFHGIGYQPMVRDVLSRWARREIVDIAKQQMEEKEARQALAAMEPNSRKHA
jgi:predicted DNA binding CopG/RHH family protein